MRLGSLCGMAVARWVVVPVDPLLSSATSVPCALACLRLVLQSLCDIFPPSGTLLDLSGLFLSAGKGVLRYSVPKWLTFP